MVARYPIRCNACKKEMVLRIQVGGGLSPFDTAGVQPFVFACPHCRAETHGRLNAVAAEDSPHLGSEDFELTLAEERPDDIAVAVASDVPVHRPDLSSTRMEPQRRTCSSSLTTLRPLA